MALHRRARAAKERGRYAAANADLEKALGLELERASALHSVEAARLSFVGTRQSVADELMALQVALHRPGNAFVTLQQVLAVAAPGKIRPQPAAEELSRRLRAERRTALVVLTQLDDFSVAWVIAGDDPLPVTWPTARKDVRAAMQRYWRSLDGAESQLHAGELFELIARPWIELVRGFDELLIVPGAELAAVPFAGLFDQRRGAYLVEDLVLRFGAVADLAPPRTAAADPAAVVVFEPDIAGRGVLQTLPGARKEAETIAARYPRSTHIRGTDAHRRALLRRLPSASIFHFAGHALPNVHAGEPGLLVSPSEREDPFVTASDLAALDLSRVDLVTLSGCSTARAGTGSWQVSWNLGRAALAAGAPAVLTTIADVADDEARDLMIDFYGSFDGPPARALAHAQRQAIQRWRADESPRRPTLAGLRAVEQLRISPERSSPGARRRKHGTAHGSLHRLGGARTSQGPGRRMALGAAQPAGREMGRRQRIALRHPAPPGVSGGPRARPRRSEDGQVAEAANHARQALAQRDAARRRRARFLRASNGGDQSRQRFPRPPSRERDANRLREGRREGGRGEQPLVGASPRRDLEGLLALRPRPAGRRLVRAEGPPGHRSARRHVRARPRSSRGYGRVPGCRRGGAL